MRFYLCDFCKHDTGPYKPIQAECCNCLCGCNFEKVDKMCPRQTDAWILHEQLDNFVKTLNVELLPTQKMMLHRFYIEKASLRCMMPKNNGRLYTTMVMQLVDILLKGE